MIRTVARVAGLAVLAAIVAAVVGCGRRERAGPFVLLVSPSHASGASEADRRAIGALLSSGAGFAVEVRAAGDAASAVDAFGGRDADAGLLTLFEYVLCRREHGVLARLQILRGEGRAAYEGEILARADGPVRSVRDLDGRRVALVDEYSASGFLLPARLFADAGVRPVVELAGSHEAALRSLREGRAEAAATWRGAAAGDAALRSIATTPTLRNEPVFVGANVADARARAFVGALEKVAATAEARPALGRLGGVTGFGAVTDADYRDAFDALRAAGRTAEDLVPQGRPLAWANRSPLLGEWP